MKRIGVVVPEFYGKNRLFDMKDPVSNRDNCLIQWDALRVRANSEGYDVMTADMAPRSEFDSLIYSDVSFPLPSPEEKAKSILLLNEGPLIVRANGKKENHERFASVLTWNDSWVDGERYFKINPYPVVTNRKPIDILKSAKDRFCVMIAGNKRGRGFGELYSERIRAIQWFERNAPRDFDLYGMGWDAYQPTNRLTKKALRHLPWLSGAFKPPRFSTYKGPAAGKQTVLDSYKFSICYENTRSYPGYISEKIFDCFWAGCVPVYWGAPNITDHVPGECFVDRREFSGYDDLYRFLKNIDGKRYRKYLDAIVGFLSSDRASAFSTNAFADAIIQRLR